MFLVIVIALLWLLHRATRLLKIPAPALIHVLGIDIPEPPKVVIDSVGTNSVILHWSLPDRSSVVKYIIEVNGRKAGEADRLDSSITLKDLLSDTVYTIKIVAVNPSNYRSHAAKLLVHTLKGDDDKLPVYPGLKGLDVNGGLINGILTEGGVGTSSSSTPSTPSTIPASTSTTTTSSSRLRSSSRANLSNRNDKSINGNASSFRNQLEKSAYSIESLTHEVESVQIEINDLLSQAAHAEEEFLLTEKDLLNELEQLKLRKKIVDQQRSQIRLETKSLEDSKRSLENQKSKVDLKYKKIQDEFLKREMTRQKWTNDIQNAQSKVTNVESSLGLIDEEGSKHAEHLESMIQQKQELLSSLEDELKKTASNARKAEFRKTATIEQVQNIQKNTDSVTGIVSDDMINQLTDNPDIDDAVKDKFKAEIEKDKELEVEWQKVQKTLEVRYLTASQQYRDAHEVHNSAVSTIQQQKQQQTLGSINGKSVVDSVNAAIAQKGKKKNRRKSNKNLQMPFLNQTGTTNPQMPVPSHYDLTITNSSSPSIQSNEYYLPGTTSILNPGVSPPSITNQLASSSSSNNSPSLTNAYTSTFPNIQRSSTPLNMNTSQFDEENPMSPSVDMLLPSNLFGTDDLTDSFAAIINDLPRTTKNHQRASATMLAEAFGGSNNRPPSLGESSSSPKPSLLSLQDIPSSPNPLPPSSPQDHYVSSFTGPSQIGMGSYNGSVHSLVDDDSQKKQPQNTAKKFSSMFFFSKQKRDDKEPNAMPSTTDDHNATLSFLDVGPIGGTRPRAGSYNSARSLGISSLHSTHGSNFFNPWSDLPATLSPTTSGSAIQPVAVPGSPNVIHMHPPDTTNTPSTAAISSAIPSSPLFSDPAYSTTIPAMQSPPATNPAKKGFVGSGMWSVFNRDRERERGTSTLKNDISTIDSNSPTNSPSSSWPDMPLLLVSNSHDSRPDSLTSHVSYGATSRNSVASTHTANTGPLSTSNTSGGNKFSKSFAELFTSSNKDQQQQQQQQQPTAPQPPSRSRSESKSIAQLFGSKSDAPKPVPDEADLSASVESKESLNNKESILQKSMRTFSTSRKSSTSSSKFVRRLSIFGNKKTDQRELSDSEDMPDQTILEDSEGLIEE